MICVSFWILFAVVEAVHDLDVVPEASACEFSLMQTQLKLTKGKDRMKKQKALETARLEDNGNLANTPSPLIAVLEAARAGRSEGRAKQFTSPTKESFDGDDHTMSEGDEENENVIPLVGQANEAEDDNETASTVEEPALGDDEVPLDIMMSIAARTQSSAHAESRGAVQARTITEAATTTARMPCGLWRLLAPQPCRLRTVRQSFPL